jgi:hypothetical protein
MAKGQAKLNDVTWKYISEVAFVPGKDGAPATTRALDVEMNRVVTDGDTGEQTIQKVYSKVPMLPLIPLPSLAITSADVNFTMEVKTSTMSKSSTDTESSISATASGKVATHKENTRSTDNSAKYEVKVHAEQLPPTEGMLKLSDFLNEMLEPSPIPLTEDPNK